MFPDIIKTERLVLRPWSFDDLPDVLGYALDETWGRFLPVPQPYSDADARRFIATQILLDRKLHPSWAIRHDGHTIGGINIRFSYDFRIGETGYSIARPLWRRGFATEAIKAVIGHSFEAHPQLMRVRAMADARNAGSHRVMEKAGMVREGVLRQNRMNRDQTLRRGLVRRIAIGVANVMDRPIDVPTRETVAFLSSHIAPGAAVLEVGCGQGHVAVALAQRGYRVTAIDSEPEIVATAVGRGAHALHATWPDFETAPVDAVAFTRSLHHIGSLPDAIRRARDVLKPGGRLLLEDFAFDQASPATIRWFVGTLRSLAALITPAGSRFVAALLAADDRIATWREHHDHDLRTIDAMTCVIADHLGVLETSSIPYLYRYLVPVRPGTPEGKASFRRRCWGPKQRVPTTSSSFASKIGSGVASPERVATEPQAGRWRGRNRCRQEFDRGKVRETCHHGHRSR